MICLSGRMFCLIVCTSGFYVYYIVVGLRCVLSTLGGGRLVGRFVGL